MARQMMHQSPQDHVPGLVAVLPLRQRDRGRNRTEQLVLPVIIGGHDLTVFPWNVENGMILRRNKRRNSHNYGRHGMLQRGQFLYFSGMQTDGVMLLRLAYSGIFAACSQDMMMCGFIF